jgi:ammonia channel protein AmtB
VIEWIETVLGVIAIACVFLGTTIVLMMINAIVKRIKKTKKEKETMSKEKGEAITFNDIFMFMIGVPLVLLWVGFAGFVIHSGLGKPEVLENIEAYTTLIAILGGPALLIIKDALDVWKQEQAEKTSFYKVKAQSVIDYNDATQKQTQMIESKAQEQEHKMEIKK